MLRAMRLERDVPLAPLTTLRLGGRAAGVAVVEREADVPEALAEAERRQVEALVLGGGSNVVVADEGFRGLVVRIASRGVDVAVRDGLARVTLAAGEPWDPFVAFAVSEGFSGVECLAGIPGSSARPQSRTSARTDRRSPTPSTPCARTIATRARSSTSPPRTAPSATARAGSRPPAASSSRPSPSASASRTRAPRCVTQSSRARSASRRGAPPRSPACARRSSRYAARRGWCSTTGTRRPSARGSFFVNPVVDDAGLARVVAGANGADVPRHLAADGRWKVPAAWLIEHAGFARGFASGHVHVSKRHSLALVNDGGGTTRELLLLANAIVRGVEARFGVRLSPEPVMVGCVF